MILAIFLMVGISLEVFFSLYIFIHFQRFFFFVLLFGKVLGVLIVLQIIKKSKSLNKDIPWIVIVLLFPYIGTLFYLTIGSDVIQSKKLRKISKKIEDQKQCLTTEILGLVEELQEENNTIKYLSLYCDYPITKNKKIEYYRSGEQFFEECKKELKKAKKFILMEFFTIELGSLWDEILDILKEKAQNGVEVRLIYDATACMKKIPAKYYKKLEGYGIECAVFEKNTPLLGILKNHRDHHKCLIIDGKIAFTGGMNIEDRYVNLEQPYGYWKDVGISLEGEGVRTFTVMFFSMWQALREEQIEVSNYFVPNRNIKEPASIAIPFGDNPLDQENIGKNTYISMIHQAKKTITIFTPYLILDMDLYQALAFAAKRGVDVKIIIPGIPDKRSVYQVSLATAQKLIQDQAKIYTYTKGFLHGKVLLVDDKEAIVGTINTDYRSLYFDFEYGVYFKNSNAIDEIKKDIEETLQDAKEFVPQKKNCVQYLIDAFLQLFSPLM